MSYRNPSEPHYVSVDQAAEMLAVSDKTVRNWIDSGLLPAFEAGPKLLRINILDIRAFCRPSIPKRAKNREPQRSHMTIKARQAVDRAESLMDVPFSDAVSEVE